MIKIPCSNLVEVNGVIFDLENEKIIGIEDNINDLEKIVDVLQEK